LADLNLPDLPDVTQRYCAGGNGLPVQDGPEYRIGVSPGKGTG
jgi:hypothetical protein